MKLKIGLSTADAVRAGVDAGVVEVELDISVLSPQLRGIIADNLNTHGELWGPGARTTEAVVQWAADKMAEQQRAANERAERREKIILEWLARSDEENAAGEYVSEPGWRLDMPLVEDCDDPRVIARRDGWRAARKALQEKEEAAKKEEKERSDRIKAEVDRAKEEARAAFARELAEWSEIHGSPRLRRCVTEGIECSAIYRDERLAKERPGWVWEQDYRGAESEIRNPSVEALALLDDARLTDPSAKLCYWVAEEETDDDGETIDAYRDAACVADFLGRKIVFGLPAELKL